MDINTCHIGGRFERLLAVGHSNFIASAIVFPPSVERYMYRALQLLVAEGVGVGGLRCQPTSCIALPDTALISSVFIITTIDVA